MEAQQEQEFLNTKQAAVLLGVVPKTILNWSYLGRVQRYRINGTKKVLFKREDLLRLVEPA